MALRIALKITRQRHWKGREGDPLRWRTRPHFGTEAFVEFSRWETDPPLGSLSLPAQPRGRLRWYAPREPSAIGPTGRPAAR